MSHSTNAVLPLILVFVAGGAFAQGAVRLGEGAADPDALLRSAYEPVDAAVEASIPPHALPLDVMEVENDSDLPYSPDERLTTLLTENGFVVTPEFHAEDVISFYKDLADRETPVYVTADSLLHVYHLHFDETLKSIEEDHLAGLMAGFTQAMIERSLAHHEAATNDRLREAARRNLAFFSVAMALLEGEDASGPPHPLVREDVAAELDLIAEHQGLIASPLFGYDEDYSQYVPRGHYTRSETLERYFRAMMWYGRMAMLLKGKEPGVESALIDAEEARIQTLQAAVIASDLYGQDGGDLLDPWERVYGVTSFFVGAADDLTPAEYATEIREVCGGSYEWATLADDETLVRLRDRLAALRSPEIYGGTGDIVVMPPFSPERLDEVLGATKGMRLMGQRFVPDSYLMGKLVFPSVGRYTGNGEPFTYGETQGGPMRVFPRGLDVMAVLGSDRALDLLTAEGDTEYERYDQRLAELREEFAQFSEEDWRRNLYWCWMDAMRSLLADAPDGYPSYMATDAWKSRMLQGALASWAELRHDTILYAKQSYTPVAGSAPPGEDTGPPPVPLAYVEPIPEFYGKMLSLTRLTRAGLDDLGFLEPEVDERLALLDEILANLLDYSKRQLRNEWLEREDYQWLQGIGYHLERTLAGMEAETISPLIVADVHTDANSRQVLEEAVGPPMRLTVIWNGPDAKLRCSSGPILMYFEFKHPMADRLTDEAWREMFETGGVPAPPAWTRAHLANDPWAEE